MDGVLGLHPYPPFATRAMKLCFTLVQPGAGDAGVLLAVGVAGEAVAVDDGAGSADVVGNEQRQGLVAAAVVQALVEVGEPALDEAVAGDDSGVGEQHRCCFHHYPVANFYDSPTSR